jgi:hypothetical protein
MTATEINAAIAHFEEHTRYLKRHGGRPNKHELTALKVLYAAIGKDVDIWRI